MHAYFIKIEHKISLETYRKCVAERNISFALKSVEYARNAYKADAAKSDENPEEYFGSVDLQKVIMLPRMPGVKTCVFTRRIVAFNETFAALGKGKMNVCALWNEAISGRNAEDIAILDFFEDESSR
jgi:hypothetical protein